MKADSIAIQNATKPSPNGVAFSSSTMNGREVTVQTFRTRWPETAHDAGILIISDDEDDDEE